MKQCHLKPFNGALYQHIFQTNNKRKTGSLTFSLRPDEAASVLLLLCLLLRLYWTALWINVQGDASHLVHVLTKKQQSVCLNYIQL